MLCLTSAVTGSGTTVGHPASPRDVRFLGWDEADVGTARIDAPVGLRQFVGSQVDSIGRTAVYVTRMHGGVGGGSREASPYPD